MFGPPLYLHQKVDFILDSHIHALGGRLRRQAAETAQKLFPENHDGFSIRGRASRLTQRARLTKHLTAHTHNPPFAKNESHR